MEATVIMSNTLSEMPIIDLRKSLMLSSTLAFFMAFAASDAIPEQINQPIMSVARASAIFGKYGCIH